MQLYHEPAREIPVHRETDVVVCGAGPAGIGAALAAARNGARTLLVETNGYVGGMITAGLVLIIHGFYADHLRTLDSIIAEGGEDALAIRGIPLEIVRALESARGTVDRVCNPEIFKLTAQEMLAEAGVKVLFHSLIVDTIVEQGRARGIIIENKSGRQAVLAHTVIDATGDGDVAARAGAEYDKGREDGRMQPLTLAFTLDNVRQKVREDWQEDWRQHGINNMLQDYLGLTGAQQRAVAEGKIPLSGGPWCRFFTNAVGEIEPNRLWMNTVWQHGDATDAEQLSRAEQEARKQVFELLAFYRRCVPGFEEARVDQTAHQIGVRDTRRIRGDYTLTEEDVVTGRRFADAVARGCNRIDVHSPDRLTAHRFTQFAPGHFYDIPYRCLLVRGIENLLTAGRCISVSHAALGSVRLMGTAMALGEAAGTAAALAGASKLTCRDLPAAELRKQLMKQNCAV